MALYEFYVLLDNLSASYCWACSIQRYPRLYIVWICQVEYALTLLGFSFPKVSLNSRYVNVIR